MFRWLQLITVIIFIINGTVVMKSAGFCSKRSSNCGGIRIDTPFWTGDYGDQRCNGYPGFFINCQQGQTPLVNISNHLYLVRNIDSSTIKVMDTDIDGQQCPQPQKNFSIASQLFLRFTSDDRKMTLFYSCTDYPKDAVQHLPCLDDGGSKRSFAFLDGEIPGGFNWYGNCEDSVVTWVTLLDSTGNDVNYTQALQMGLILKWLPPRICQDCLDSGGQCSPNKTTSGFHCLCVDGTVVDNDACPDSGTFGGLASKDKSSSFTGLKLIIGVLTGAGAFVIMFLLIYRRTLYKSFMSCWRKKSKSATNVEVFLESYGQRLALQRYRYSEIKRMTNSFKDALGQGGFGSVFKGKLKDGRFVAVKVLNESKGNGEEFINEVATIGGTNHVNVVSLLGFCTDGIKRALVYEFMPNGSLEKYIFHEKDQNNLSNPLGSEKLFQIALGTARGLDYLHRGCNIRILHLDIKPHNILLDEEFCPKISDFGLAKLCPPKASVVSMHLPRGTIGYIAPEVYCINFGRVSHKSDVYSYGIMVLEMIAGRKNIDGTAENTSEAYLPRLIYNRFEQDIVLSEFGEVLNEGKSRKMIMVAFWCIQTQPADRPPMSKVVEMLEGTVKDLQMPPNPFVKNPLRSSPSTSGTNSKSSGISNCLTMSEMDGR